MTSYKPITRFQRDFCQFGARLKMASTFSALRDKVCLGEQPTGSNQCACVIVLKTSRQIRRLLYQPHVIRRDQTMLRISLFLFPTFLVVVSGFVEPLTLTTSSAPPDGTTARGGKMARDFRPLAFNQDFSKKLYQLTHPSPGSTTTNHRTTMTSRDSNVSTTLHVNSSTPPVTLRPPTTSSSNPEANNARNFQPLTYPLDDGKPVEHYANSIATNPQPPSSSYKDPGKKRQDQYDTSTRNPYNHNYDAYSYQDYPGKTKLSVAPDKGGAPSSWVGYKVNKLKVESREEEDEEEDALLREFFTTGSEGSPPTSASSRFGHGDEYDHDDFEPGVISEEHDDPHYHHGHHYEHPYHEHEHEHEHKHHYPEHFAPVHHHPPTIVYYPDHHHSHHKSELSKLGLLAVAKIVLAKIKAFDKCDELEQNKDLQHVEDHEEPCIEDLDDNKLKEPDTCLYRVCPPLRFTSVHAFCFYVTLLNKLSLVAPQRIQPRLSLYTQAYQLGSKEGRTCDQLYQCDKPNLSISKGSIIYNLL
uniref:Uncharacterized protein n=1 Tax=Timema genevievae TaxID=629358 RepID=A0A7R9PJ01_TIMGE|nr:unnamed protein product [Timema genevievae]